MTTHCTLNQKQVRSAFNKAAPTYGQASILQQEIARRLATRLSLFKQIPETILDAGCGTGFLLNLLQRQYPKAQFFGLDFAFNMLLETRKSVLHAPLLIAGDLHALPIAAQSVDLIVCNCVLQWCYDLRVIFLEFQRILKPEGTLLFTTMGPDTLIELKKSWATMDSHPHVHSFLDLHVLGDALLTSGLQDPVMDMQRITLTYQTLADLFSDLRQIGATNHLRERMKGLTGKTTFQKLQHQYEQFRTQEGLLPATYEIVFGYAKGVVAPKGTDEPSTYFESPQRKQVRRVIP